MNTFLIEETEVGYKEFYTLYEASGYDDIYQSLLNSDFQKVGNIRLPKKAKPLGTGTKGWAFDIGSGKILKITTDTSEVRASAKIRGKKLRGVWNVYDVLETDDEEFWNYGFIIGEKLDKDSSKARDIRNEFGEGIQGIGNSDYWTKEFLDDMKEDFSKEAQEICYGLYNLNKLGISWHDMKVGNIMFKKGKAVIIDLGYSHGGGGKINTFHTEG